MSYVDLTASVKEVMLERLLGILKQELKKFYLNVYKLYEGKNLIKTKTVTISVKRSSIVEHLINNTGCANNNMLLRFRAVSRCSNVTELV